MAAVGLLPRLAELTGALLDDHRFLPEGRTATRWWSGCFMFETNTSPSGAMCL
jgi:hypothetical protein